MCEEEVESVDVVPEVLRKVALCASKVVRGVLHFRGERILHLV